MTPTDISDAKVYVASCVHNCGQGERCVSKLHVSNGRVVRITSDEDDYAWDGSYRDKNQYNDSRSLACAKGRAYKYQIYHSGRLRYALKQTKKRGDMSGFIRMTTGQALKEIAEKYRSVTSKYGPSAYFQTYGTSGGSTFSSCGGARTALTTFIGGNAGYYSNYSFHQFDYFTGMTGHPQITGWSANVVGPQTSAIAGVVKNIVAWGSNILSTNGWYAYPYIRAVEEMKARYPQAKYYFIGPEFTDTGVTLATDWVQLRNYTDAALAIAMMYEMIVNTFNEDGSIKDNPWLDVDYIDTMVYGFFDSPEYWVNSSTTAGTPGEIVLTAPAAGTPGTWRKVDAVPAGQSLSAYIMGTDERLTKAGYGDTKVANYTAEVFKNSAIAKRNMSKCSYKVKGTPAYSADLTATKYLYKQDMMKAKTPEWAEAICGTPAATIRELAKLYALPENHPVMSEWCGGLQKQDNGVVSLFAIASMMAVSKTWGYKAEGIYGSWGGGYAGALRGQVDPNADYLNSSNATGATPSGVTGKLSFNNIASVSCKEWSNLIKVAFMEELVANGYTGKHVPEWDKSTRYLYDDGGAKTGVVLKRTSTGLTTEYTDATTGLSYFDYVGREDGKPVYSGVRMIVQPSGGIQLNQHPNTNDTAEMYRCLSISGDPKNADTFCLVQFDVMMSPGARFADYVIPAVATFEAGDWASVGGQTVYRPPVSKAPGEAKDGWTLAYEAYKAQVELGSWTMGNSLGADLGTVTVPSDAHYQYVRTAAESKSFQSAEALSLAKFEDAVKLKSSRFYGKTVDEAIRSQYLSRKTVDEAVVPANTLYDCGETAPFTISTTGIKRRNLDEYLALPPADRKTTPFVFTRFSTSNPANTTVNTTQSSVVSWGSGSAIADPTTDRPEFAGRMQVYNGRVVWEYIHKFSKYHGWLPADKRGQSNKDYEGDPEIYPIPMYFHFQDRFNEMYGVFAGKTENDLSKKGGLTLGTTHDRYRVHSTLASNPLMRELNHRTKGGKWASANDWNEYCVVPERQVEGAEGAFNPMISTAVNKKNLKTASWHEIWINSTDASERGIVDGDLVRVENPVGAVRVIARVTDRCVRGHVNLHQGGWYDPNPVDGVDDGGCANTLMSSKPSRYDNGNSQQMAYVTITKETSF